MKHMPVYIMVIVTALVCGSCADMNAGRTFNHYDSFSNRAESGVMLGSVGMGFGSGFSVHQLALSRTQHGDRSPTYAIRGEIMSQRVSLRFRSLQVKLDDAEPIGIYGSVVRPRVGVGRYGNTYYESFMVVLTESMLGRMADAASVEVRFHGDGLYSEAYSLTERQQKAIRLFYDTFVRGLSEEEHHAMEQERIDRSL